MKTIGWVSILHKSKNLSSNQNEKKMERGSYWRSPFFGWKSMMGLPFIKMDMELEQTHTLIQFIHLFPKFILLRTYNRYSQETKSNAFSKSTLKRKGNFLFLFAKSIHSLSTKKPSNNPLLGMNFDQFLETSLSITLSTYQPIVLRWSDKYFQWENGMIIIQYLRIMILGN